MEKQFLLPEIVAPLYPPFPSPSPPLLYGPAGAWKNIYTENTQKKS